MNEPPLIKIMPSSFAASAARGRKVAVKASIHRNFTILPLLPALGHSLTSARLQSLDPGFERRNRLAVPEPFAREPDRTGRGRLELVERVSHAGAAGRREDGYPIIGQVAALQERVDDRRRDVPPDRETDQHRVVPRDVGQGKADEEKQIIGNE